MIWHFCIIGVQYCIWFRRTGSSIQLLLPQYTYQSVAQYSIGPLFFCSPLPHFPFCSLTSQVRFKVCFGLSLSSPLLHFSVLQVWVKQFSFSIWLITFSKNSSIYIQIVAKSKILSCFTTIFPSWLSLDTGDVFIMWLL